MFTRLFATALLAFTFSSPAAFAKKKDKDAAPTFEIIAIEKTGISAFDDVFMKAKGMNDTLSQSNDKINSANDAICVAVGVAKGSPVTEAIASLKEKAPGMLTVTMEGTKPVVATKPEAPDNIKAAVDGINKATKDLDDVVKLMGQLPKDAQALVDAAKEFPAKAPAAAKESGLKATEIPGVVKLVKNDTKSTLAIPANCKVLGDSAVGTLKAVGALAQ